MWKNPSTTKRHAAWNQRGSSGHDARVAVELKRALGPARGQQPERSRWIAAPSIRTACRSTGASGRSRSGTRTARPAGPAPSPPRCRAAAARRSRGRARDRSRRTTCRRAVPPRTPRRAGDPAADPPRTDRSGRPPTVWRPPAARARARSRSRKGPRAGHSSSFMAASGARTSSRARLPSGLRNIRMVTSLGMSCAGTVNGQSARPASRISQAATVGRLRATFTIVIADAMPADHYHSGCEEPQSATATAVL